VEFFFGHDWQDVSMEEFMETLDDYLSWYRDGRLKSDLGYMSPAQYRRSLGLAA
jgi:transposase InsO family protein